MRDMSPWGLTPTSSRAQVQAIGCDCSRKQIVVSSRSIDAESSIMIVEETPTDEIEPLYDEDGKIHRPKQRFHAYVNCSNIFSVVIGNTRDP
jgi:hypothetical protein